MKKIYVSHAASCAPSYDYKRDLYAQLCGLKDFELIFPHERSTEPSSTKELIASCDAVLAEVSYPSHGVGIELGWASAAGVPIICIYQKGVRISSSLKTISKNIIEYDKIAVIFAQLNEIIDKL